jgi:hypothetical protein
VSRKKKRRREDERHFSHVITKSRFRWGGKIAPDFNTRPKVAGKEPICFSGFFVGLNHVNSCLSFLFFVFLRSCDVTLLFELNCCKQ